MRPRLILLQFLRYDGHARSCATSDWCVRTSRIFALARNPRRHKRLSGVADVPRGQCGNRACLSRNNARRDSVFEQRPRSKKFLPVTRALLTIVLTLGVALLGVFNSRARAGPTAGPATQPAAAPVEPVQTTQRPAWYNVHGQSTVIAEDHDAFHDPYEGNNSLRRHEPTRTSWTGTLYFGAKLPWQGGEAYFNPEVAGGEGFSGVLGIAGFPNGEIPRVGTPEPEAYIARLFYRQTFGFGGKTEKVEDGPNQLPGMRDVSRLTLTAGKFGAVDFFQQSAYSNDPRSQFMNWALFTGARGIIRQTRAGIPKASCWN